MIEFGGSGILLDIEGTTSSVSFVYDVMFPFVRRELGEHLRRQWTEPETQEACRLIAVDAGFADLSAWCAARDVGLDDTSACQLLVAEQVQQLMDGDVKATGLKQLQGLIWRAGFESGEMEAHLYDDVLPALQAWRSAGLDVRIYSSGSIAAQQLFFGHTAQGNILHLLGGHYDTNTGAKQDDTSYAHIAANYGLPAERILFLSDVPGELDAARAAGMQTALCRRPGNDATHDHHEISSFAEVIIVSE